MLADLQAECGAIVAVAERQCAARRRWPCAVRAGPGGNGTPAAWLPVARPPAAGAVAVGLHAVMPSAAPVIRMLARTDPLRMRASNVSG